MHSVRIFCDITVHHSIFKYELNIFTNNIVLFFLLSEYKRYRSYIKKKSDQVLRLRKKAKKDVRGSSCSLTDPSVQRLIEQTSRDLNNHYKQLSDHEKKCLRRHADKNLLKSSIKTTIWYSYISVNVKTAFHNFAWKRSFVIFDLKLFL
jgi:hypothetical protein